MRFFFVLALKAFQIGGPALPQVRLACPSSCEKDAKVFHDALQQLKKKYPSKNQVPDIQVGELGGGGGRMS